MLLILKTNRVLRSSRHGGIPVNWLLDNSSNRRELRLQKEAKTCPLSLLFVTMYPMVDGGGIDNRPCNLLNERSNHIKLSQGMKTRCW